MRVGPASKGEMRHETVGQPLWWPGVKPAALRSGARQAAGSEKRLHDRWRRAVFTLAIAFLAFVGGGIATFMEVQPVADYVQKTAMVAVYLYKSNIEGNAIDPFWHRAHSPGLENGKTVSVSDSRAWPGLNLVLDSSQQGARLIDMQGNVVHRWARRFDEIWTKPPQVPGFAEQGADFWRDKVHWRRVHLYPNGDVLVVFGSPFRTPYGFGMAKLDRHSNVIWKLSENAHHDAAVAPDGTIYVLNQHVNTGGYAGYPQLEKPFIDDMVTAVSADGKKIKDISIIEAFMNSDYAPALDALDQNLLGDVMHVNTVQYIDAKLAAACSLTHEGDLLISMREMDMIALLDPKEERIVWAMTGLWRGQHEPQMLENGVILLYDNQGHKGAGGMTRIIEYDPHLGQIVWSYAGTKADPLVSAIYGSQQRLPNGNTLIVETNNGRAIEVTRAGEIVWEYRVPYRKTSGSGTELTALLSDLVRFDPAELSFLNRASAPSAVAFEESRR